MKLTKSLTSLLCLMLTVILCASMIPSSAAALQKAECDALRYAKGIWFYVPSTVPVMVSEWSRLVRFRDSDNRSEFATSCTIRFVSGDEALKDALKYRTYTSDFWDAGVVREDLPMMDLYIDNEVLKEPGTAVFHVKAQSQRFVDEGDITVRVLSWDDYPLVTEKDGPHTVNAQLGEFLNDKDIIAAVAELHVNEIAADLKSRGVKLQETPSDASFYVTSSYKEKPILTKCDNADEQIFMAQYFHKKIEWVSGFYVEECGIADIEVTYSEGNIYFTASGKVIIPGFKITGPKAVKPGEAAQYKVINAGVEGRTFTLSFESDIPMDFDRKTMVLGVPDDTPEGTAFRLTATPSDGSEPAVLEGIVSSGLFANEAYELEYFANGFSVPLLSDKDVYFAGTNEWDLFSETKDEGNPPYIIAINYTQYKALEEFAELYPQYAIDLYSTQGFTNVEITGEEIFEIDGHPARLIVGSADDAIFMGAAWYMRNNHLIRALLRVFPKNGSTLNDIPKVTPEDVKVVAGQITYDPSKADITVEDGALSIATKGNETVLPAGKKLAFTAAFANPGKVNRKAKNDKVEWSVTDTATGKAPEDVTIDAKGSLSAAKTLKEILNVEVRASSPIFHTSAACAVTVIPASAKVSADPAEVFFYTGTDAQETVQAVLDPDTVPLVGITWKLKKEGVVELTPGGNGTAVLKPLAAGKTAVTVSEPGGKNATVNVTVTDAVTAVELTAKGKSTPGGTVTVAAVLQPKTAGNKQLKWSLDVGEDIATVNEKGQVRISGTAPAGTVFHVTCTALGAPEPVSATVEITVAGK